MSGMEIALLAAAMATTKVIEGVSAYQQGKAEKQAYDANAEILRNNAARKRLETSLNEDIARSDARRSLARLEANAAENGQIDSPTTTGLLGQAAADEEQNILNMRYAGMSEAENYDNQARLQNYYGKQAAANGRNAFKMSFLTGGVKGLSTYYGLK